MSQAGIPSTVGHLEAVQEGRIQSQALQILARLATAGQATAQELGVTTGLGAYTVSKRRGGLLRSGCIEEMAPRKCTVTGRLAQPVRITDAGRDALEEQRIPEPAPSRRDLEGAVLRAARDVAAAWASVAEPPAGIRALLSSVWNLDHASDRHRGGLAAVREPWGSPRRAVLAMEGKWLRQNGQVVFIEKLNPHHLQGAIEWCQGNAADPATAPLLQLLQEQQRRSIYGQVSALP